MQTQLEKAKTDGVAKMIENLAQFKARIENDQNLIKSKKKEIKGSKQLTTAQLVAIKDKLVLKNENLREKQEWFEKKQEAKKQQKEKQKKNKGQPNIKPQTAPSKINRTPPKVEVIKKNIKSEKVKQEKKKEIQPKVDMTQEFRKQKINEKTVEFVRAQTAPKPKRSQHSPISKKDKDKLKQEMKTKIQNLPTAPFKAKKLDEETVASVRKALSVLVDKALDTLQKVPREKLKAASMNLQKKDVKLKSRLKPPPIGDPTAQLQAKIKENVIKGFEKVGTDILLNRSKNV